MNEQRAIAKWGFGMAPISSRMRRRYDVAVLTVCDLLYGNPVENAVAAEALSELKGMFNRYVLQNQWDYAMVGEELGNPPPKQARRIADELLRLRRYLKANDEEAVRDSKRRLEGSNVLQYLNNYQNHGLCPDRADGEGWIYVLSKREEPNILKIGRTQRSVSLRVKEINAATGVLIPFGARYVFRVKDAAEAEKVVHQALGSYRIRDDREFFDIAPRDAERMINKCFLRYRLRYRTPGTVAWFDRTKFYGFIANAGRDDIFVHGSEITRGDVEMMTSGAEVEFDLNRNRRGAYATEVTICHGGPSNSH